MKSLPKTLRMRPITVGLCGLVLAAHISLLVVRDTTGVVSGDEGTYLAMISSLALDGDLSFTAEDRERLEQAEGRGRKAVILQTTERGVSYSKPAAFAFVAAPFFRVLGEWGVVAMNALALIIALALSARALQQRTGVANVGPAVVTFAGASVLASYVPWTMSDSLQASLVLAGVALALGATDRRPLRAATDKGGLFPWSAVLGGALLGIAASMRYPNLLLAAGPAAGLFVAGQRRRSLAVSIATGAALAAALGVNAASTGAVVPYKAVRATFNVETGYPAGDGAEQLMAHFNEARATQRMGMVPNLEARTSLFSTVYFFIGRHTGILLYGPAALLFAWGALRRRDALGVSLLLAVLALAGFYLLWMPRNYFGGATFIGNRYFLTGYALLLLAPNRLPRPRALASVWAIGAVVLASALWSSSATKQLDGTSQMHANRGVFRLLPYESTATDIDGRRDRYWSDELVRFVDPWARVGKHGFKIFAGAPAAELVTASGRAHGAIRLLVQANVPRLDIVYSDWLDTKRFTLVARRGGAKGLLEVVPSATIRRHPYWWDPGSSLSVRSLRLRAETPDGSPARVDFRYIGPYRFTPKFYRGELESLAFPKRAKAGRHRRVPIRVQNTGSRYWSSEDPIPVFLSYRVYTLPRADEDPVAVGPLTPLPGEITRGATLDVELDVVWPREESRYAVDVDLVVAGISWFEDWVGAPLATREVRVVSP